MYAEAFKLMTQNKITPEEAQKEAIQIIANQVKKETGEGWQKQQLIMLNVMDNKAYYSPL